MKNLYRYLFISLVSFTAFQPIASIERPIVAITIPKCGTHLLAKCITLLTGKFSIPLLRFNILEDSNFELPIHYFTLVHAPYTKRIEESLIKQNSINFFLTRDPRDQVVSLSFYFKYMQEEAMNVIHPQLGVPLKLVDINRLILDFIVGAPGLNNGMVISQFYDYFLPWLQVPNIRHIKFEKLVGPQGGGTARAQAKEIKRISNWLGLRKSQQELADIAQVLFGKSTFREGKIGSWKKYFTEEHKQAFKKVAGQLLISLGYEKDLNW